MRLTSFVVLTHPCISVLKVAESVSMLICLIKSRSISLRSFSKRLTVLDNVFENGIGTLISLYGEDAFKSILNSMKASKLSNVAATQWSSKLKSDWIFWTSGGGVMSSNKILPPPEILMLPAIPQLMQLMAKSLVL